MAFQPQIPLAGVAGWRFLQRTGASQQAAFETSATIRRDVDYFREKIGSVTSATELVAERRLLKVALGAFGLEGDIDKKAFVRRVLEENLLDVKALANRLTAPAYKDMAKAFGFGGLTGAQTGRPGFAEGIVAAYKTRAFESAVGEVNDDMRLALNFRREIADLSAGETGGSWYSVIGSNALRKVFEKAYGLPTSFGQLDVDRQRDILRDKTSTLFGTSNLSAFASSENVEKILTRFLARSQIESGAGVTSPALTLLQNASSGSSGLYNLLASR